jgi:hypothetical protein
MKTAMQILETTVFPNRLDRKLIAAKRLAEFHTAQDTVR